jgi:hypothetical protein
MSSSDPFITIFTAPKPFTNPHINLVQRNAIQSWQHLSDDVVVLLVGDEEGMADFASEVRLQHLPDVDRNKLGTPLVSSIFELAHQNSTSPLLAYVNADMLLTPEFVNLARQVLCLVTDFLLVGQRWDLDVRQAMDFNPGWEADLMQQVNIHGRLHPPGGSDYFIFPRKCFSELPRFAIGRAGWDNWMFYHARLKRWPVVDLSSSLTVIHQDHDYSHLPGGQPHYQMPESHENIHLAGGRRTIFTLLDADYTFHSGKLSRNPLRGKRFWRNLETYPLIRWQSYLLAELAFALFHPIKAFGEWRGRLAYKLNKSRHQPA